MIWECGRWRTRDRLFSEEGRWCLERGRWGKGRPAMVGGRDRPWLPLTGNLVEKKVLETRWRTGQGPQRVCRTEPEHRGDTDVHGGPAMLLSDVRHGWYMSSWLPPSLSLLGPPFPRPSLWSAAITRLAMCWHSQTSFPSSFSFMFSILFVPYENVYVEMRDA